MYLLSLMTSLVSLILTSGTGLPSTSSATMITAVGKSVEAARRPAVAPRLHAMNGTEPVQLFGASDHFRGNPCALRALAAAANHVAEGAIDRERECSAAQCAAEPARRVELLQVED